MLVKHVIEDGVIIGMTHVPVDINPDGVFRQVDIDDDRYGGCYSGSAFTAWPGVRPHDIDAGDSTCEEFWNLHRDALHGEGSTPQSAFLDLTAKIDAANLWDSFAIKVVFDGDSAMLTGSPEFAAWREMGR